MPWSSPSQAVRIIGRDPVCGPVPLTSHAVAWVPQSRPVAHWALRLYGIESTHVTAAVDYVGLPSSSCPSAMSATDQAAFEPYYRESSCDTTDSAEVTYYDAGTTEPLADGRIQFLDATYEGGDFAMNFMVQPASARPQPGGESEPMLQSTCIPLHRYFNGTFTYATIDYDLGTVTSATGSAVCYYGGVEVLRLPDGRWLMLLHCLTTLVSYDPTTLPNYTSFREQGEFGPNCSMVDIVCYVADDANFRDGLSGPYLVVNGRDALPDYETPTAKVKSRLYLGVPSGVIFGDYLYVYYAFAQACCFSDNYGCAINTDGTYDCDPAYTAQPDVASSRPSIVSAFNDAQIDGTYPKDGVACKRIALTDLFTHLAAAPEDQSLWEWSDIDDGVDQSIPGELLGRIKVWVSSRTPVSSYPMEDALNVEEDFCTGGDSAKIIDPAAAKCPSSYAAALTLYFSHSSCAEGDLGGGLWVAKAIAEGESFTAASGDPVVVDAVNFGKHFFIPVTWGTEDGAETLTSNHQITDRFGEVEESGFYVGEYQNPDVVQLPSGAWRVTSGGGSAFHSDTTGATTSTFSLSRFDSEADADSRPAAAGFCE